MFRDLSNTLNKELSKEIRQNQGIFFTPKKARDLLFDKLAYTPTNILEPSFGSGEFIEDAILRYPNSKITGVEFNEKIFKSYKNDKVSLIHNDFMKYKSDTKFDCIIGNPPYFVIKEKNTKCMIGRPNIYVAFLYKCLELHLADKGVLAFILPTSLYNCSYYEPMRKYIYDNCSIEFVETLDVKYYETGQDTMLIVIKKEKDSSHQYFYKNYITPYYQELNELVIGTTTIKDLGLFVKTGDVVWNQEKDKLSNEGTLLIYSTNIVDGTLVLDNILSNKLEKKQYIKDYHKTPIKGKAILVNRGYGNAKYKPTGAYTGTAGNEIRYSCGKICG